MIVALYHHLICIHVRNHLWPLLHYYPALSAPDPVVILSYQPSIVVVRGHSDSWIFFMGSNLRAGNKPSGICPSQTSFKDVTGSNVGTDGTDEFDILLILNKLFFLSHT